MKHLIALPLIILFFSAAISQTPESILQKVQQQYMAEKIYFHYDKSFYLAGETVWFKAYLMEGYLPSAKSTVLAVELLNDSGKLVDKKSLPVTGSAAIGEFTLNKNLPQGNYTVKAYTRNLMNFGFEQYYYHHINIYNPSTSSAEPAKKADGYSIYFFPEGGNMIANVKNTIAFKCTDNSGIPKDIEGKILDANGNEQGSFKSIHDGMGTFELVPKAGEKYIADCLVGDAEKKIQPLPVAAAEGVTLNITRRENKTFFQLDATTVTNEKLVPHYILGVQENLIAFKVPVPVTAKRLNGEIPVTQLPSGILQITVFNKENKPLAERLVFINSGDYTPAGVFNKNLVDLKPRGKNSFSYNLEDTIAGTFSVSVTEDDGEQNPDDHIISRFLLTSDIKGIVYNPAYYFESNDALHQQNLDLIMLTNGWRKYSWNELLANRFPSMSFKDPGYITVEAQALHPSTGKPLANADITVLAKMSDKKTDFLAVTTDSAGNFLLDGMVFEDTATFTFQTSSTKNSRITTGLRSQNLSRIFASLKTPLPALPSATPSEKMKAKFKEEYNFNKLAKFDGILLDEVKVKTKLKSEKDKYETKYVSGRMGSSSERTLDFLSEPTTSTQNIFSYLQSRLNGVNITGGPLNYSIVYRNARSLSYGPIQMNVFLDEFQVEPSQIATMSISQVAMVKVYSSGGLSGGAGGSLAIYTKKGDGLRNIGIAHEEVLIEGFTPTKEFFSPDYAETNKSDILNDQRSTLYWNPYLITNAKNKSINFSFYNSDKAKKFKVVLEGIREDGKLLHVEKIIE